jgi:peroxiredoxin
MKVVMFISLIGAALRADFAWAQSPNTTTATSQDDSDAEQPKPEVVLRQMADFLSGLPAFSCRIEMSVRVQVGAVDRTSSPIAIVRLDRPNRLAMLVEEQGAEAMRIASDGQTLTQYFPMRNRYVAKPAPSSFAELADAGEVLGVGLVSLPATAIPFDGEKLYQTLTSGVKKIEYVASDEVDGVRCHRCRLLRDDISWDIWIEAGHRPLVHKIVPDFSKQFANGPARLKDAKMESSVVFTEWNLNPQFADAEFAINLPGDAEQVDSVLEAFAIESEDSGPHPLVGQPAPPFKTVDVDEKPIDLAAHLGKNVVMLDFWATWCGPCIQAMPEIEGVAKKFIDRGLVFYAVNVAEDAETVKEFLKSSGLEPPVAMDLDGSIAQRYQASGIPQTVLIGKDGKVHVVHVGLSDGLGDLLSTQIEDLLAGKDLAGTVESGEDSNQASDDNGNSGTGLSE